MEMGNHTQSLASAFDALMHARRLGFKTEAGYRSNVHDKTCNQEKARD
jgi:hypothetical protein